MRGISWGRGGGGEIRARPWVARRLGVLPTPTPAPGADLTRVLPGSRVENQCPALKEVGFGSEYPEGGSPRKPRAGHHTSTSDCAGWEVERSRVGGK